MFLQHKFYNISYFECLLQEMTRSFKTLLLLLVASAMSSDANNQTQQQAQEIKVRINYITVILFNQKLQMYLFILSKRC